MDKPLKTEVSYKRVDDGKYRLSGLVLTLSKDNCRFIRECDDLELRNNVYPVVASFDFCGRGLRIRENERVPALVSISQEPLPYPELRIHVTAMIPCQAIKTGNCNRIWHVFASGCLAVRGADLEMTRVESLPIEIKGSEDPKSPPALFAVYDSICVDTLPDRNYRVIYLEN